MSTIKEDLENDSLSWDQDLVSEDNQRTEISGINDDMARADSGELAIVGLSKCLGLAVYDSSSEVGYAAHVKTADKDATELAEYLSEFNTMLDIDGIDYGNSEIMIAGIDYSSTVSEYFIDEERELDELIEEGAKQSVAEEFAKNYFSDAKIFWNIEEGRTSGVFLDIDEGVLEYDASYNGR
ncbi:MAG: hypothetical protein ACI977_000751 [Candidatus Nanohaloarchaea archaeon]|jgi:hypothetical protein